MNSMLTSSLEMTPSLPCGNRNAKYCKKTRLPYGWLPARCVPSCFSAGGGRAVVWVAAVVVAFVVAAAPRDCVARRRRRRCVVCCVVCCVAPRRRCVVSCLLCCGTGKRTRTHANAREPQPHARATAAATARAHDNRTPARAHDDGGLYLLFSFFFVLRSRLAPWYVSFVELFIDSTTP